VAAVDFPTLVRHHVPLIFLSIHWTVRKTAS